MTVLLTGADGYLGWPTALRLADRLDERIVCVDDFSRRDWVAESGSVSATQIEDPEERFARVENLSLVEGDLADRDFVLQLLTTHEPDTVLHAAAQPSAPYSSINGERALYTQRNNVSMTLNLLHGLHETGLSDTHFIETTTTGIYGAPHFPIPEGGLEVERKGGEDEVPFPAMGGSWYHQTKSFDAANMRLAESQFDFPMSEVRTAIVYGTETDETRAHESPTRFDFDYYFGTVVNRFCAQAVGGYPITVYGKGEQRKPMVSLEDAVESLVRLVEQGHSGDDGIDVYNQVTRPIAIVELAETIAEVGAEFDLDAEVKHYENPREEDEEHKMEMENERFLELVGGQRQDLESGIRDVLGTLVDERERIAAHEDRFLPGVLTDE
ncbi:NAD-dependent epimerase/dehydratase family protein [Halorubrum sp. Atlit-8R]|uniref:NAD-dependent epimerase/dehydratase family protein n=1 Tax=unclassified Halorubrum TaxID=2642239 RepID=UPI000EF1E677|nr:MULTISPECIES: NAD-dependent epimerase/dehydratase family protein [unclassified Halorubrum]RLM70754.1 NAD-dependent epimerase/dehydratase family protein [Halorubrum sp. Atlit-9R]RLM71622.1 NAD-dependent epimerase/dehydratase family protein [Halorubrum sp. Atlit-9R]RLM83093.1 NAD-dependent epimerase/dehydratase family protein [Halorubrum sp. Atlit-8R]